MASNNSYKPSPVKRDKAQTPFYSLYDIKEAWIKPFKNLKKLYADIPNKRLWHRYTAPLPYKVKGVEDFEDCRLEPAIHQQARQNHPVLHAVRNVAETVMMADIRSREVINLFEIAPGSGWGRRKMQLKRWSDQYRTDPEYGAPPKYYAIQPHLSSYDKKYLMGDKKIRSYNQHMVNMEFVGEYTVKGCNEYVKGAYYLGNVCYYLDKQEWLQLSEVATMGIYVYSMEPLTPSGDDGSLSWSTDTDGNVLFKYDDGSQWHHPIDWLSRLELQSLDAGKVIWCAVNEGNTMQHCLYYFFPKAIIGFKDYSVPGIGLVEEIPSQIAAEPKEADKEEEVPPPTSPSATTPDVECEPDKYVGGSDQQQILTLTERLARLEIVVDTMLKAPKPKERVAPPQPPNGGQDKNGGDGSIPPTIPPVPPPNPISPPAPPPPPPPPGVAFNIPIPTLASLTPPFVATATALWEGLERKCATEWRPFSDLSHYIWPKPWESKRQLALEFPDPLELEIAETYANIALTDNSPEVRMSYIQSLSRAKNYDCASVVDIAVRCEPTLQRARERLRGQSDWHYLGGIVALAFFSLVITTTVAQMATMSFYDLSKPIVYALSELISAVPSWIWSPLWTGLATRQYNKGNWKSFIACLCALFITTWAAPALWASRKGVIDGLFEGINLEQWDNFQKTKAQAQWEEDWASGQAGDMWRFAISPAAQLAIGLETLCIYTLGPIGFMINVAGDAYTWGGIAPSSVLVHMMTLGMSGLVVGWKTRLAFFYFASAIHTFHNMAVASQSYQILLGIATLCALLGAIKVRHSYLYAPIIILSWFCVFAVCTIKYHTSTMSGYHKNMGELYWDEFWGLAGDLFDSMTDGEGTLQKARDFCYSQAPRLAHKIFYEMVKDLGATDDFACWYLEELYPRQILRQFTAIYARCFPALYANPTITTTLLTIWSLARPHGRAVSAYYDMAHPSPKRGLEIAPVCMGNTNTPVRPGATGTPPSGKCSMSSIGYHLMGPRLRQVTIGCHKGCSCNTWRAMVDRMGGLPKRYKECPNDVASEDDVVSAHVEKVWNRMKNLVFQGVPQWTCHRDWPVKLHHWQWEKRYPVKQATKLRTSWLVGGQSTGYTIFVKKEKLMLSRLLEQDDPTDWSIMPEGHVNAKLSDPRGISVPPPSRRYECGPEADYYNKTIMRLFNGQVYYACGSRPELLGQWVEWIQANHTWGLAVMGDDVLVLQKVNEEWEVTSLDISRFDQHIRECHLQVGFDMMAQLKCKMLRKWMMKMCLPRNYTIHHPFADGHLRVTGTRASGDPDTISSNSLITILVAWDAMIQKADLRKSFWDAGFVVTGDTQMFHVGKWDFLQKVFYPAKTQTGCRFHPAPKIGRFVARAFWSPIPYSYKNMPGYCRGVALSLQNDFKHVPIARALVSRILELTEGHEPKLDRETLRAMEYGLYSKQSSDMDPAVYQFIESRYGFGKAACDAIENRIARLKWDEFVDDEATREFWEAIIRVDL